MLPLYAKIQPIQSLLKTMFSGSGPAKIAPGFGVTILKPYLFPTKVHIFITLKGNEANSSNYLTVILMVNK